MGHHRDWSRRMCTRSQYATSHVLLDIYAARDCALGFSPVTSYSGVKTLLDILFRWAAAPHFTTIWTLVVLGLGSLVRGNAKLPKWAKAAYCASWSFLLPAVHTAQRARSVWTPKRTTLVTMCHIKYGQTVPEAAVACTSQCHDNRKHHIRRGPRVHVIVPRIRRSPS